MVCFFCKIQSRDAAHAAPLIAAAVVAGLAPDNQPAVDFRQIAQIGCAGADTAHALISTIIQNDILRNLADDSASVGIERGIAASLFGRRDGRFRPNRCLIDNAADAQVC